MTKRQNTGLAIPSQAQTRRKILFLSVTLEQQHSYDIIYSKLNRKPSGHNKETNRSDQRLLMNEVVWALIGRLRLSNLS